MENMLQKQKTKKNKSLCGLNVWIKSINDFDKNQ